MVKEMNCDLIWKGKAGQFGAWAKTMEQIYGKETPLWIVVKDLKERRLKGQLNYMLKNYGKTKNDVEE